jgi:hypothetical protein
VEKFASLQKSASQVGQHLGLVFGGCCLCAVLNCLGGDAQPASWELDSLLRRLEHGAYQVATHAWRLGVAYGPRHSAFRVT